MTDRSGVARLDGMPVGISMYVEVTDRDQVVARASERVVTARGAIVELEIDLGGGVPLTGELVDQLGVPMDAGHALGALQPYYPDPDASQSPAS